MKKLDKRSKSKLCKKKLTSLKGRLCFILLGKIIIEYENNVEKIKSIIDTVNSNVKQQFENEYLCNSACDKSL
jgi:predicted nucleotidyltransferase